MYWDKGQVFDKHGILKNLEKQHFHWVKNVGHYKLEEYFINVINVK